MTLPLSDSSVRSELTKRLHNAIVAPAGARALLYESKDVGVWTEVREMRVGAFALCSHGHRGHLHISYDILYIAEFNFSLTHPTLP